MPFKPPEQAKCPKCGKSVYAAEERVAAGAKYHKFCFKCGMCNKMLDSTTVANHELDLYCKQCHGRKFGPKGYGFGGGAGALGMDKGERFGNKACEMDNKPKEVIGGGGGESSGTGPKCPRCGKTVYDAERAIGVTTPWHKSCFNCKACHKTLDSTTMAMHETEVYCKNCYGKNFGPSGYGFGQGAGTLSMG
ncbi:cysteine and glycine-rich protein 1-like [Babylonia areolata]|uniref:cysteine and glycine-rich protein 1-like n=1 Tax=Babylonia areolata TaxID=304850 RepID=UPI003FD622C3